MSTGSDNTPTLYYYPEASKISDKQKVTTKDVLGVDKDGLTLIHKALERKKDGQLIRAIIELSTEKMLLKMNKQGETPLHLAVWMQRSDVVKDLVDSRLMTPKVFFKPNYHQGWIASRVARERVQEELLKLPTQRDIDERVKPKALTELHNAKMIVGELSAKQEELKAEYRLKPKLTKEQEELHIVLDKLSEKVNYLLGHKHFDAANAIRGLEIELRSLDYDSCCYPTEDASTLTKTFRESCKRALNTVFANAPAMAQIDKHRGIKALCAWLVGFFYDVAKPENKHAFFTPRTDTSKILDEVKKMFPGDKAP